MTDEAAQLEEGQEVEQEDSPAEGAHDEDSPKESNREAKTVPLATFIQERKEFQSKISALEGKLAQLEREATTRAKETGGTADETARARSQWRKALGIEDLQGAIDSLKESFEGITGELQTVKASSSRADEQYFAQIEGFVVETYYNPSRHPVDEETYQDMFAKEIQDDEIEPILKGGKPGVAVLEKIAKRVDKRFPGLTNAAKAAGDFKKVHTLPKVPGRGGAPAPAPPDEPVTGKALHQKAGNLLQDLLARRT